MKKLLISILSVFLAIGLYAQEMNKVVHDRKADRDVLIGYCDRDGLKGEVFGEYFDEEYRTYEPDIEIIRSLKSLPGKWNVTIVMGSWCSDTQREVPRFFRIMDEAGIPDDAVEIIAVDRKKKAGEVDIEELEVALVPTFIFYKDGKEIGRIIEVPNESLEKDVLLITARPPKPSAPGR